METLFMILPAIFGFLFVIGIPLLFIYVIYRAIKALMTHNAELKNRYVNNGNQNSENRWTGEQ